MRHPIPGRDYFPARVLIRRQDMTEAGLQRDMSWPFRTERGPVPGERLEPSLAGLFPSFPGISFALPHRPKA